MSVENDRKDKADWFRPAIEADGSVFRCLSEVESELARRKSFVAGIRSCLCPSQDGLDEVSSLARKAKSLENTLRYRLEILRPEREGAWFRAQPQRTAGPLATLILSEPILAPYDLQVIGLLRDSLVSNFEKRTVGPLPFRSEAPCIWRTLLEVNQRHEQLCQLPAPFAKLRLDRLPDDLPEDLTTWSIEAFLKNVKQQVRAVRSRLDDSYEMLLEASDRLWEKQRESVAKSSHKKDAAEWRQHFRERRSRSGSRASSQIKRSPDLESLKYMGFQTFPDRHQLRERYLTLAKKLHPDRQGGSEAEFKKLTTAYRHLESRLPN